jgi:emp24/gp25L/p24 family/GOLD
MKDVIITITPRDMMGVMIVPNMMKKRNIPESEIPIKCRHPLEQRNGTFTYYTGALNGGSLEICIQSYTANVEHPSRVALRIENTSDQIEIAMALQKERQILLDQQRLVLKEQQMQEQKLLSGESSRISAELMRLYRRAKGLNEDVEYTKESESRFFTASVALNKTVRNWYLVRVSVLLITGYLQASYIMKYMKARNMFW